MRRIRIKHLKPLIFLPAFWLALSLTVSAQTRKTDLQTRGLKGRVKTVESYNIFYAPDGSIIKKYISSLDYFNAKGRLTESIQIIDQGDESFYHRYKFGFDRKGRNFLEETYVSSKGRLQDIFLPDIAETNIRKPNPQLTEKPLLRISYKFDAKGNVSEETVIDSAADEILKSVYAYDKNGDVAIYTSKNNGASSLELSSVYKENRTRLENTNYQNSIPVYKTISCYNRRGRFLYREQFTIKPAPDNDGLIEIPAYRTNETTRGNMRETETISFDNLGLPATKSVHTFENGMQKSQIVYKFQKDGKSNSFIFYQTKTEYKFDKFGSWKKSTVYKQEGANPLFFKNFSIERKFSYY